MIVVPLYLTSRIEDVGDLAVGVLLLLRGRFNNSFTASVKGMDSGKEFVRLELAFGGWEGTEKTLKNGNLRGNIRISRYFGNSTIRIPNRQCNSDRLI